MPVGRDRNPGSLSAPSRKMKNLRLVSVFLLAVEDLDVGFGVAGDVGCDGEDLAVR
jgi:hypothetical protein